MICEQKTSLLLALGGLVAQSPAKSKNRLLGVTEEWADAQRKRSSEFIAWDSMKQRCLNPKTIRFKRYGGRGITVCDRWLNSFENFYKDMGARPTKNHSLDRIRNDGNYEPSNCRWATRFEQSTNKSSNRILEFNGEKRTIIEWSKITGIHHNIICIRVGRLGWSVEKSLTRTKIGKRVFTDEQESEIKKVYESGNYTQRALGIKYGISCILVRKIIGRKWRYV